MSRKRKDQQLAAHRQRWRRRARDGRANPDQEPYGLSEALSRQISAALDEFVSRMGCEPPRPIERIPGPECQVAECHANVLGRVHFRGGRPVWGWHFALITDPGDFIFQAVFHAVWESPEGDLVDITPQSERVMAGQEAGVFTPQPFFCEDKKYFRECELEYLGNGLTKLRVTREVLPERQCLSTGLGITIRG